MTEKEKKVHDQFCKKLAKEISNGEYTVETWPSDFESSIKDVVNTFDDKTHYVLSHRLAGLTQREIAELKGLSITRIQQLEHVAVSKMERPYKKNIALYGYKEAAIVEAKQKREKIKGLPDDAPLEDVIEPSNLSIFLCNYVGCKTLKDAIDFYDFATAHGFDKNSPRKHLYEKLGEIVEIRKGEHNDER